MQMCISIDKHQERQTMIIGVINQKGGVGKTTIAINLAAHYAMQGSRVLLVDSDSQQSSMAWATARKETPLFPVIAIASEKIHREMPMHRANYDHIIIDGAPRNNKIAASVIAASDLVL